MLLEHGLTVSELIDFFRTCQKRLLLAGYSRAQRLPHSRTEAVRDILRFPDKAHRVLSDWLREQSREIATELVQQLVPRFHAIEREGVEFSDEDMYELCRCGLDNLYSDAPQQNWLDYLAEESPTDADGESNAPVPESGPPVNDLPEEVLLEWAKWAAGSGGLDRITDARLQLLAQVSEAARSRAQAREHVIAALRDKYPRVRALLSDGLGERPQEVPAGVQAQPPPTQPLEPARDYARLHVIATRPARAGSGPFRLDVEAFVDDKGLFILEDSDLRLALPNEGRVILHAEPGRGPPIGEPLEYRIERFDTRLSIKIRVVEEVGAPIPIFYVPHPSTQPDLVREFILACAKDNRNRNGMFVTAEGLCLKARFEPLQRLTGVDFDWLFDSWWSVSAVEFRTGAYVAGPLPPASGQYDCAPLSTSARLYLRALADRKAIKATRGQIAEIVERLREEEDKHLPARRARIAGKLEELARSDAEYDELIEELMRSTVVREDIEVRKKAAVAEANEDLKKAQNRLEVLRRDKETIERRLNEVNADLSQRVRSMRTEIQRVFETAKANEAATLGELALWQAIAGKTESSVTERAPASAPQLRRTDLPASGEAVADVLRLAGFPDHIAVQYAAAIELGSQSGLALVITGPGAFTIGTRIGQCLATETLMCLDVPVGLLSEESFVSSWTKANSAPVLIRNANLSDLTLYAPQLLEHITERVLKPTSSGEHCIVITGTTGPAALPWPPEVTDFAAKLSLAHLDTSEGSEPESGESGRVSPLRRKLWSRLERAAEQKGVDGDIRSLLLKLLKVVPDR